jgi:hypothetical protein
MVLSNLHVIAYGCDSSGSLCFLQKLCLILFAFFLTFENKVTLFLKENTVKKGRSCDWILSLIHDCLWLHSVLNVVSGLSFVIYRCIP